MAKQQSQSKSNAKNAPIKLDKKAEQSKLDKRAAANKAKRDKRAKAKAEFTLKSAEGKPFALGDRVHHLVFKSFGKIEEFSGLVLVVREEAGGVAGRWQPNETVHAPLLSSKELPIGTKVTHATHGVGFVCGHTETAGVVEVNFDLESAEEIKDDRGISVEGIEVVADELKIDVAAELIEGKTAFPFPKITNKNVVHAEFGIGKVVGDVVGTDDATATVKVLFHPKEDGSAPQEHRVRVADLEFQTEGRIEKLKAKKSKVKPYAPVVGDHIEWTNERVSRTCTYHGVVTASKTRGFQRIEIKSDQFGNSWTLDLKHVKVRPYVREFQYEFQLGDEVEVKTEAAFVHAPVQGKIEFVTSSGEKGKPTVYTVIDQQNATWEAVAEELTLLRAFEAIPTGDKVQTSKKTKTPKVELQRFERLPLLSGFEYSKAQYVKVGNTSAVEIAVCHVHIGGHLEQTPIVYLATLDDTPASTHVGKKIRLKKNELVKPLGVRKIPTPFEERNAQ